MFQFRKFSPNIILPHSLYQVRKPWYTYYVYMQLTCVDLPDAVVFNGLGLSDREGVVPGCTLALPDEEGPRLIAHLQQLLLRIHPLDTTKEPTEGRREIS